MTDPRAPSEREKLARSLWRREEPVSPGLPMQSFRPQPSLARRDDGSTYQPPRVEVVPGPTPPPALTTIELRHQLNSAIEEHKEVADRVARLELAQEKARQQCRQATAAVEEAEALLSEAMADEPKSYVQRLLSNGDASDEVDIVEAAQRRLAEAQRKLKLARHAEDVIAEEVKKAQLDLRYATGDRDNALKALVVSHKAVEKLVDDYHKALSKAAELRLALEEAYRHMPPKEFNHRPRDFAEFADGVLLNARGIETDGAIRDRWTAALKALATDPNVKLPGE